MFNCISEQKLCVAAANWMLRYARTAPLPGSPEAEAFLFHYRLPPCDYTFTQSYLDVDGFVLTHLKTSLYLRAWQTRGGLQERRFTFYKILKSSTEKPDDFSVLGYILVP